MAAEDDIDDILEDINKPCFQQDKKDDLAEQSIAQAMKDIEKIQ